MPLIASCDACGTQANLTALVDGHPEAPVGTISPPGWGITGIQNVTPFAYCCANCRALIGGYTVSSFFKVNSKLVASGSAAAVAYASGVNLTGTYVIP